MANNRFTEVEKYLDKFNKVKLENDSGFKFSSVANLLNKCQQNATLNAETGGVTCGKTRRRTVADLFKLAQYYGYKGNLESFYNLLIQEIHDGEISSYVCNDIKKRIYQTCSKGFINSVLVDEWGIDISPLTQGLKPDTTQYGFSHTVVNKIDINAK